MHRLFPAISVPTSITGIAELESIVTMSDTTVDRFLCEIADNPQRRHYDLRTSLPRHTFAANPSSTRGGDRCPGVAEPGRFGLRLAVAWGSA